MMIDGPKFEDTMRERKMDTNERKDIQTIKEAVASDERLLKLHWKVPPRQNEQLPYITVS